MTSWRELPMLQQKTGRSLTVGYKGKVRLLSACKSLGDLRDSPENLVSLCWKQQSEHVAATPPYMRKKKNTSQLLCD